MSQDKVKIDGLIGFDFGTTNSLISFISNNKAINMIDEFGLPIPSVVCYEGNEIIVGREAKTMLKDAAQLGVIGNVVNSPKTLLGKHKVNIDGIQRSPTNIVAEIVRFAKKEAEEKQPAQSFNNAVVTIPVDMIGERRRELRQAFQEAGVNIKQFIHEPLAALYGHLRSFDNYQDELMRLNKQLILVFDWGGGTLDLTLCELKDEMLVQIMNDGCSNVGGDNIDEIIANEIELRHLKEKVGNKKLQHNINSKARLRAVVEDEKIRLSKDEQSLIFIDNYFNTENKEEANIYSEIRREEMEIMIKEKIDEGIGRIEKLLQKCSVDKSSIEMCLATGGMVNMPIIQSRLKEIFGPQRVNISERGNTIIAEGAAWIANDDINLSLAKNIELSVARDDYYPILKAETEMPRLGERLPTSHTLYCTDPRDGFAKFQILSPIKYGKQIQKTDERDTLSTFSVEVDEEAEPLLERLNFDTIIDHDLILTVKAESSLKADNDGVEIHNLEFGLELPGYDNKKPTHSSSKTKTNLHPKLHKQSNNYGTLKVRPNITESNLSKNLIPGELRYQIWKIDFDLREHIPEIQRDENNYYMPCSVCKKTYIECKKNNCLRGAW